jgi:hypothetical protein
MIASHGDAAAARRRRRKATMPTAPTPFASYA